MTTVTIGTDCIKIKGHAKKAIACHGISAISNMVANYVVKNDWGKVTVSDGFMEINDVKEKYRASPLFKAMLDALKDIEEEYPGNLIIEYK